MKNSDINSATDTAWVSRVDACRIFGMGGRTFVEWERIGRIPPGKWTPLQSGKAGRRKRYPLEELRRCIEHFRGLDQPYPDPERSGCYRVPVMSYFKVRYEALVDAESLSLVVGKRWNWMPRSDGLDAVVVLSNSRGTQVPLRRIILGLKGAQWRVRHANGDPLDCRRANLIVENVQEQLWRTAKKGTVNGRVYTSKYKGVFWNGQRETWQAKIQVDGNSKYLGRFADERSAAEAYDIAARRYFGESAWLNFPDEELPLAKAG